MNARQIKRFRDFKPLVAALAHLETFDRKHLRGRPMLKQELERAEAEIRDVLIAKGVIE